MRAQTHLPRSGNGRRNRRCSPPSGRNWDCGSNQILASLIPVCAWCKNIRDGKGRWQNATQCAQPDIGAHFTHGICPACFEKMKADFRQNFQQTCEAGNLAVAA